MANKELIEECRKPSSIGCGMIYAMAKKIAADNNLPTTEDILIAILKGYERGCSDCNKFVSDLLDDKPKKGERYVRY